jgi:hypothetical protein
MTNVRLQDVLHIIYVRHYEIVSCDIRHMQLWIDDNTTVEKLDLFNARYGWHPMVVFQKNVTFHLLEFHNKFINVSQQQMFWIGVKRWHNKQG